MDSYYTDDVDEAGWHRAFVTVSDGRLPGTYVISKQHSHEDYHQFSQENLLPGSRRENRKHTLRLANDSVIEHVSKQFVGYVPESKDFKSNLPDNLHCRGGGSLHLEGACSEKVSRKRRSYVHVTKLKQDHLPASVDIGSVQWSNVKNLGGDKEVYNNRTIEYLVDCISEVEPQKVFEECVYELIRRLAEDSSEAKKAVRSICEQETPQSFRWPYLVQSLGVSKTGQQCLASLLRNTTLSPVEQMHVIKGTHLVTDLDETLADSLIAFTQAFQQTNLTLRLAGVLALGLVAGVGNPRNDLTLRILDHLHSSLYMCPQRDYSIGSSQFQDYVVAYTAAVGNVGHDSSFGVLMDLGQHEWSAVRRASIYSLRFLKLEKVEPVLVQILTLNNTSSEEKLAAVDTILSRRDSDKLSPKTLLALEELTYASAGQVRELEDSLLKFFERRQSDVARGVVSKARSIREKKERKATLISRVRVDRALEDAVTAPFKPLLDKEFGVNYRKHKEFGGSMLGTTFDTVLRNLAVVYLSIFDGKAKVDISNGIDAHIHVFGKRISLFEGKANFLAELSFKNEFLSAIVDVGHKSVVRVMQMFRGATAVVLQFVHKSLNYLENISKYTDEILNPIQPILDLTRKGLEALDIAVHFGQNVQTFMGQAEDFVNRIADVNRLLGYFDSLNITLTEFAAKILGELKALVNRTVTDVVQPAHKVKKLIDKGMGYVNGISESLNKLQADKASEFNRLVQQLAETVVNRNNEFLSSGGRVFDIVQSAYAQLSSLLNGGSVPPGLPSPQIGGSWWPPLHSKSSSETNVADILLDWKSDNGKQTPGKFWFSGILSSSPNWTSSSRTNTSTTFSLFSEIKGLENTLTDFTTVMKLVYQRGRKGLPIPPASVLDLEKVVSDLDDVLFRRKGSIDSFIAVVHSYSNLDRMVSEIKAMATSKLLSPKLVTVDLSLVREEVMRLSKVCDLVHKAIDDGNGWVESLISDSLAAHDGLISKVKGYLDETEKKIFGKFELSGSYYSVVSVKDKVKDIMEYASQQLDAFIKNQIVVRFNKVVDAFSGAVASLQDSKIDKAADLYDATLTPVVTEWISGRKDFVDLVKLATNISDFATVIGEAVPSVKETSETVLGIIDKVLDATSWAQDIRIKLSYAKPLVGYADKANTFINGITEDTREELESTLRGFASDFNAWLSKVTADPIRFLELIPSFNTSVKNQLFSMGNDIIEYIHFIQDIRTAAVSSQRTFNVTCTLSSSLDHVVRFGGGFEAMWVSLTALANAIVDGDLETVVDAANTVASPSVSLGQSIARFQERLRNFNAVYKNYIREILSSECFEDWCIKNQFLDDVEQLVEDAKEITESLVAIAKFEDVLRRGEDKLLHVKDLAKDAYNQMMSMAESVQTDLDVVRLVKTVLAELASDATFSTVSVGDKWSLTRTKRFDQDVAVDTVRKTAMEFLKNQLPLVQSLWSNVERVLQSSFATGAMKFVNDLVNANTYIYNFFESLSSPQEVFKPVYEVMVKVRNVGNKLNQFFNKNFVRDFRSLSAILASYTANVADMGNDINKAVFRTIELAVKKVRVFRTEVLPKVKYYLDQLVLQDRGLKQDELQDASQLPYCSNDLCIRTKPRSTRLYRDWFFPIKYSHFNFLQRGRKVIPGLFEDYQVQGISSIDLDGTYVALSMFGTGINENLPNLLVVIHKSSGQIQRLYRILKADREPLGLPLGLTVAKNYLWLAGVEKLTETTAKGVLYGIKIEDLGSYSEGAAAPRDLSISQEYDTNSYGTAISYHCDYLWIADFVDEKKTSVGTPFPKHHMVTMKQYGFASAYKVDASGLVTGTLRKLVKPTRLVTIGEHVTGFVPFNQAWIPYFAILRCAIKAGYICKVEFLAQPNTTSQKHKGVPVRYGVELPLARGFPIPSGGVALSFIEKSTKLLLAFKSGAQAEQAMRQIVGGDLEDSFFWFIPPVLENSLSLEDVVKKNEMFLNVLGQTIVPIKSLISLNRRVRRASDDPDCFTGSGELYNMRRAFVKTGVTLGPYLGFPLKLDFEVTGTLVLRYETSFCPARLETRVSLIPEVALYAKAEVALNLFLVEGGARIEATIMDTKLVPTLALSLKGESLQICGDLTLSTRPLDIRVFAFVRLLGPMISVRLWPPSIKIWMGVYSEVNVPLFSWSAKEAKVALLPKVCHNSPDSTAPVKGTVEAMQTDWQSLLADWVGFKDDEAEFIRYSVYAGTAPGIDNIMSKRNVEKRTAHLEGNLKYAHGQKVFVTVVCSNSAGRHTTATSKPFVADVTPPVVIGLGDGPGPDDRAYSVSKNSLEAYYDEITDESNIEFVRFVIGTAPGADDVQQYREVKSSKRLSNYELRLQLGVTYYFSIIAQNVLGLQSVTSTNGILVDYSPPVSGNVYDDSLDCRKDSDYQIASIYYKACWFGFEDSESDIAQYEWKVAKSDGHDVFPYQNVGLKLGGYKAGILLQLGQKYVVIVRAWNKAGLTTKKQSNGTYVDYTRPECSTVHDLVPGVGEDRDYVTDLPFLKASWHCIDRESGLRNQEAAVGTYPGGADAVPFTKFPLTSNGSVVAVFNSINIIQGRPLYVTIRLTNKAGLRRTEWSDGIALDNTPPIAVNIYVRDGPGVRGTSDRDFQTSTEDFYVRWHGAFIDNESPIIDCYVGLNASNGSIVQREISVGAVKQVSLTNLQLISGSIYLASVRCVNAAGLSTKVLTDGVLVDTTPPNAGVIYDGFDVGKDIKYWAFSTSSWGNFPVCLWYQNMDVWPPQPLISNPPPYVKCAYDDWYDDESGLKYFETTVVSRHNATVTDWKREQTGFNVIGRTIAGKHGQFYFFKLRAYNRVDLYSEALSNGIIIDETIPQLSNLIEYDSAQIGTIKDIDYVLTNSFKLASNWTSADTESEIYHSDWAIGSYFGGHDILDHTTVHRTPVSHKMSNLDLGKSYYVLLRVTNRAGLRLMASSDGFMIDFQVPSLGHVQDGWGLFDLTYQSVNNTAWMKWRWIDDFESGLESLEIAVSLRSRDAVFTAVGTITKRAFVSGLSLPSGVMHYAFVRATDKAGLSSVSYSNGFIVDMSPPQCFAVREGFVGGLDKDVVTTANYLTANWDHCVDTDTGIKQYQLGISRDSSIESDLDYPFRSFGTQTKSAYLGIALDHGVKYYTFLKAINFAGLWSWVVSNGVTVDLTPPECEHFGDGIVGDKDYEVRRKYHAVNWQCTEDVGGITKAVLSVGTYAGGFDVRRSDVDASLGKEVNNNTVLREGITLFSTLVLWNSAGLRAVYNTDGISVDTSPPTALYVRDGPMANQDIEYQSSLTRLSANWRFRDDESGMDSYEVRFLPSPQGVPRYLKVNSSYVTVMATLDHGGSYSAAINGINRAGLSVLLHSNGVKVDSTPATCAFFYDGFIAKQDVIFLSLWDSPAANWECNDAESGIASITWRIYRHPVVLMKEMELNKHSTRAFGSGVALENGGKYYSTLTVKNTAGLTSTMTSDGFVVDATFPVIETFTIVFRPPLQSFDLSWYAYDNESDIKEYWIAIGTDETLYDVLSPTSVGTKQRVDTSSLATLKSPMTYFLTLVAINGASAKSHSTAIGVADETAPIFDGTVIASVVYPQRAFTVYEKYLDDAVVRVQWSRVSDRESGVKQITWTIKETGTALAVNYPTYAYSLFSFLRGNVGEISNFKLYNNTSYEVVLSAENGVGLSSYVLSTSFTIRFGTFIPGKVSDGSRYEDDDYQTHTAGLWARWENFYDKTNGIQSYSLGFGTSPGSADVLNFTDMELELHGHAIGTLSLKQGVKYYATVVATNKQNVTVSATSNGLMIDATAPICKSVGFGMVEKKKYFNSSNDIWVSWNCSDLESGIDHYDFTLGTRPSSSDLLTVVEVRDQSKYRLPPLNLTEDSNGYLTLTVFNKAGLTAIISAERILFDFHAPSNGTIGVEWDNRKIRATCSGFKDNIGIDHYEWSVGTSPGDDDVVVFTNSGPASAFITERFDIVDGVSYYVTVIIYDSAGNSATVSSEALVADLTPPKAGDVAEDSFVRELDFFTGEGRLPVVWEACIDNETSVNDYFVAFQTEDGEDVMGPISVGLSNSYSFFTENLARGVRYYTKISCANSLKLWSHSKSDGFVIDGTKPVKGQVSIESPNSRTSLRFLPWTEVVNVSWSGFSDAESGIHYYSWSFCSVDGKDCPVPLEQVETKTEVSKEGLNFTSQQCYIARVEAVNKAGLVTKAASVCTVFDKTRPRPGKVTIGGYDHKPFWSNATSVSVVWRGYQDDESGIYSAALCVETSPDSCDSKLVANITLVQGPVYVTQLRLKHGQEFFASVSVINRAGILARATSSGTVIDITPPTGGEVTDGQGDDDIDYQSVTSIVFSTWFDFDDDISGISFYQWGCGTSRGIPDIVQLINVGLKKNASAVGLSLKGGQVIYSHVVAHNAAGLQSTVSSDGFLVDSTPPNFAFVRMGNEGRPYVRFEVLTGEVAAHWDVSDSESGVRKISWSVCHNETGRLTCIFGPTDVGNASKVTGAADVISGVCYFVTVEATNYAGLRSSASSDCTMFDGTAPVQGTVYHGSHGLNQAVQSDSTTLSANWFGFQDIESPIYYYSWSVGTSPGSDDVIPWSNIGHRTSGTFSGLSLKHGETYFVNVGATNKAGLSQTAESAGVLIDTTEPVSGQVYDGWEEEDVEYSSDPTTVFGRWDSFTDDVSAITECSWCAGTKSGKCDIAGPLSVEKTEASTTGHNISSGTRVYVNVNCENSAGLTSKSSSNGYIVDTTPPWKGVVNLKDEDGVSLNGYRRNTVNVSVEWDGFGDKESTIFKYSVSLATQEAIIDGYEHMAFLNAGNRSDISLELFQLLPGVQYRAVVRAENMVGLSTEVVSISKIVIDVSEPAEGEVSDGLYGIDGDRTYQAEGHSLSAYWSGFVEDVSGVSEYRCCFGSGNITNLLGCINTGLKTEATLNGLSLFSGVRYIATVTAFNFVGMSQISQSDGVVVDLTSPKPGNIYDGINFKDLDFQSNPTTVSASWTPFLDEESQIDVYTWEANLPHSAETYVSKRSIGLQRQVIASNFGLTSGTTVVVVVTAYNGAGLSTTVSSDGVIVDVTPPVAGTVLDGVVPGIDIDFQTAEQSSVAAHWHGFVDEHSGIAGYTYAVAEYSYDTISLRWVGDTIVARTTAVTKSNMAEIPLDRAKIGYKYDISVTAHNNAGLTSTAVSDGVVMLENNMCFVVQAWDGGMQYDINASRHSDGIGAAVQVDRSFSCPSNNIDLYQPLVSTDFLYTVLQDSSNTSTKFENKTEIEEMAVTNETWALSYEPPGSPCCVELPDLPPQTGNSDSVVSLISVQGKIAFSLASHDHFVVATDNSVAVTSRWDTSKVQVFPVPTNKRKIRPGIAADKTDDVFAVVYDEHAYIFSVGEKKSTMTGQLVPQNISDKAAYFCQKVDVVRRTALFAVVDITGFLQFGLVWDNRDQWRIVSGFGWRDHAHCNIAISVSSVGTFAVAFPGLNLVDVYSYDSNTFSRLATLDSTTNSRFPEFQSVMSLLPETGWIAIGSSHDGNITFFSLEQTDLKPNVKTYEFLFRARCPLSKWTFAGNLAVDEEGGMTKLAAFVPSDGAVNIISLDTKLATCNKIGFVINSHFEPGTIDTVQTDFRNQTIASMAHSTNQNETIINFAAICNPNNTRLQTGNSHIPYICQRCAAGELSTGAWRDDCTLCANTTCLEANNTRLNIWAEEVDVSLGNIYRFRVKAKDDGGRTATNESSQVVVDFTVPTTGDVYDGKGQDDLDYSNDHIYPGTSWGGFYDEESGIMNYAWCVGSQPGICDVFGQQNVGNSVTEAECLQCSVSPNRTYYSTVFVWNWAGLNASASSDGFTIDLTPPVIVYIRDGPKGMGDLKTQQSRTFLQANWDAYDTDSGIEEYLVAIGSTPLSSDIIDYKPAGQEKEWIANNLNLQSGTTYYFSVMALNGAGLSASKSSDGVLVGLTECPARRQENETLCQIDPIDVDVDIETGNITFNSTVHAAKARRGRHTGAIKVKSSGDESVIVTVGRIEFKTAEKSSSMDTKVSNPFVSRPEVSCKIQFIN